MDLKLFFTDVFGVSESVLDDYGAFNISLATDLPLFIDPFLLFSSNNPRYNELHNDMINYLLFLKNKSEAEFITEGLLRSWYYFSEVKQNWFGFCKTGNRGHGLGKKFAVALNKNLVSVFQNFGVEEVTKGSHIEKLCLIESGVGRDMISDFTTNLIKDYLLTYTEKFALSYMPTSYRKKVSVDKVIFNYNVERWMNKNYQLPYYKGDFVLLTPKDILTKDETWINHSDMIKDFEEIPNAIENDMLRAQINNYLYSLISAYEKPSKEEYGKIVGLVVDKYPEVVDYYIKLKEDSGAKAEVISIKKVNESHRLYIKQFGKLAKMLTQTVFYNLSGTTREEALQKIYFLKDVIENKGGHRLFYINGEPILKESDVHILYRLTWHNTMSDVSREVNNGRGPVDFKISRGASDKALVEFKLAKNPQLKRNLQKQVEIYQRASDAEVGYKVIIYFTENEQQKVKKILRELDLEDCPYIQLIDARYDNKPSGSVA